jgi:hypothetical protein
MRPRGWIQDSGSLDNLIKIVEIFDNSSISFRELRDNYIDDKILNLEIRSILKFALENNSGYEDNPLISFHSLVGTRTSNDEVNSLIQVLIPGQNRVGIVDWACDNFVRFAYTLDFITYVEESDSFTITQTGLELTRAGNVEAKYEILKSSFKKYPPLIRVLELLYNQYDQNPQNPSLTKFEIGRELGFKGEDGFSTYSQNVFIQALNSAETTTERSKIRQNWEGSSDKYARMICGWLTNENINWVTKTRKSATVQIGNENFTEILQSYQITISGISAFRSCRAYSRNAGTVKNVYFEMLATKGTDREYLRIRRTYLLDCIKRPKTIEQINRFYESKKLNNISFQTIKDDIENLKRIGLEIAFNSNCYHLKDEIILLEIPNYIINTNLTPSSLEQTKQVLRDELNNLDHKYLDILDFSISGTSGARQFEVRIVELLNEIIIAKHLSGGNRPEIIGYNPEENPIDCFIMDSKAYSEGFNIPANERDKMIRYIEEYNAKDVTLNSNKWWEEFKSPEYPTNQVKYGFISSSFTGQYLNQLAYITNRTNRAGCLITAETLLRKVNNVLNSKNGYNISTFFTELGSNQLLN